MPCVCEPNVDAAGRPYVQWIGSILGDCVYSPVEITAVLFGLISIGLYLISMFPQLWKNYQRKAVDGLSLSFLCIWILGDFSNLLGAVFTNQLPTVQYTGMYFIASDLISILQYVWYAYIRTPSSSAGVRSIQPFEEEDVHLLSEEEHDDSDHPDIEKYGTGSNKNVNHCHEHVSIDPQVQPEPLAVPEATSETLVPTLSNSPTTASSSPSLLLARPSLSLMMLTLLAMMWEPTFGSSPSTVVSPSNACDASPVLTPSAVTIGVISAWISGFLYFLSRVPQIITNYRLKDVEGLSLGLFTLTICANLFYGLSLLLRPPEMQKFLTSTLPFVIGSMGTLVLDLVIITQAFLYGNHSDTHPITRLRRWFLRVRGGDRNGSDDREKQ